MEPGEEEADKAVHHLSPTKKNTNPPLLPMQATDFKDEVKVSAVWCGRGGGAAPACRDGAKQNAGFIQNAMKHIDFCPNHKKDGEAHFDDCRVGAIVAKIAATELAMYPSSSHSSWLPRKAPPSTTRPLTAPPFYKHVLSKT